MIGRIDNQSECAIIDAEKSKPRQTEEPVRGWRGDRDMLETYTVALFDQSSYVSFLPPRLLPSFSVLLLLYLCKVHAIMGVKYLHFLEQCLEDA